MPQERPFTITINGKFTAVLLGLIFSTMLGFNAWLGVQVFEIAKRDSRLEKEIAIIQGNRFTSQDGYNLVETILQKLPPRWLVDQVEKNEARIEALEKRRR